MGQARAAAASIRRRLRACRTRSPSGVKTTSTNTRSAAAVAPSRTKRMPSTTISAIHEQYVSDGMLVSGRLRDGHRQSLQHAGKSGEEPVVGRRAVADELLRMPLDGDCP